MTFAGTGAETLGAIFEGIVYGAYMVLFILYLILRRRNHRVVDGPLALAQIVLFCLCTTSMCLDIPTDYFDIVPDVENNGTAHKLSVSSMVVFSLSDCLAQTILLYRCWIVWDRQCAIVAVPGFLSLVTLGGGLALLGLEVGPLQSIDQEKFVSLYVLIGTMTFFISLGVNALTTLLLVTKILLVSREVRSSLGSDLHRSLRIITAMVIESGLLMFAFQLVFAVLFATHVPAIQVISGSMTHIYGITPTLLSIRVAMGSAYDKPTERTRSLRFAHSLGAATRTSGLNSAAGVQSRVIDIDYDDASNERATDPAV